MINSQWSMLIGKKKYRLPKIFPMQLSNTETTQKPFSDSQHLSELNGSKLGMWRKRVENTVCEDDLCPIWLHLVNLWVRIPFKNLKSACPRSSITCNKLQTSFKFIVIRTEWKRKQHYTTQGKIIMKENIFDSIHISWFTK